VSVIVEEEKYSLAKQRLELERRAFDADAEERAARKQDIATAASQTAQHLRTDLASMFNVVQYWGESAVRSWCINQACLSIIAASNVSVALRCGNSLYVLASTFLQSDTPWTTSTTKAEVATLFELDGKYSYSISAGDANSLRVGLMSFQQSLKRITPVEAAETTRAASPGPTA
jgi:hypothetical protein